ncbi:hypothetical protein CkaCkLH20_01755 [Colletotrichum karsti]|uniref:NmrA-like domain-containing protein n=1 Tax=Colletotrichum karsti TaxID=1095194 RepID=A0A9P6ID92_9PEZI|nr:uncharacterized protein CkaCkLH20_01755 [Colletotrichum karsti]KAF9880713.1 hypothetical protein CkaCkLH20_01755 [Colletotrichum karsti]
MVYSRIALAGATGNLGGPILKVLLEAGFHVTALTRNGGNLSRLPIHPSLEIVEVDVNSFESLLPALAGIDVVISCLATLAIGGQKPLIDAAVSAEVKVFIPAEFGMDSANPLCAQLPVCAPKVAVQEYLLKKSRENPAFTFTAIANGLFLDWGLQNGLIIDLKDHTAILYNGGDVPFSATTLADVATAVLGVIRNRSQTANRVVYIHSALVTQNQLIEYAKDVDGMDWSTSVKDTEELRRECLAELAKGSDADVDAAMLGFCFCGSLSRDYGCDFSSKLDNTLLGVKGMSDGDLRSMMVGYLGKL